MLFEHGKESLIGFRKSVICRYIRAVLLLLIGAGIVSSIAFLIFEFDTASHGKVYAVHSQAGEHAGEGHVQAGLLGVVSGVTHMEQYSSATRLVSVAETQEEVLAGARGLDRRAIHRTMLTQGMQKAKELGYYAQQAVLENQMSSDEYYTLLQIVEAEATGGDVTSKMMVAGVVLNRVRDSHFPDTITDVVWQNGQFQPTADGRIYTCTVTDSTIEAVDRVLRGEDVSGGALFFFARDSAEAQNVDWFDSSLIKIFEYGGHEYFTFKDYIGEES